MGSAGVQGALWGAAARDWADYQEATALPLWRDVLRAVGAKPGMRLLDAGCGSGGAGLEAARLGCEVTGIDASATLLEIARERLPAGRFKEADLESLPFADATFGGVIAVNSVFYAADPLQATRELTRVTRAGGRVVVTGWGKPEDCEMTAVFNAVAGTLPFPPPPGGGPFSFSAPGTLEGLLGAAGLQVVDRGETQCDFCYPDVDACWRAQASAGPVQAAMAAAGEERIRAALTGAASRYADPSGALILRNMFLWAAGERRR